MRPLVAVFCALLIGMPSTAQKKKKEEETQTLKLPEELPNAVAGQTGRLAFHTTPLTAKGLLSPQVRDALKALQHEANGETVLKIRVFVAGSGDLRHVRDLISEFYTQHKQPLPTVALVKVGALPLEGAQVEFEGIAEAKKEINPSGLAFLSPTIATAPDPLSPAAPLLEKSVAGLRDSLNAAKLTPADAVRVTCFLSSLAGMAEPMSRLAETFPHAALDYVQPSREPGEAMAGCEAVARLHQPAAPPAPGFAPVTAPQLVLSGSQYSFGYQDSDAHLAFERLGKSLEQAGSEPSRVVFAHFYPLSPSLAAETRKAAGTFFPSASGTTVIFEGLPSMDAGFGVDVVAVK